MLKGIDVSRWQGDIDWKKVKESGIQFVIIKAGGSDDGYYTDSKFEKNYTGAKAVGLKVGCYYFNGKQFVTHSEGAKQAEHFASIIKGKQFEFPVYCDVEAQNPSDKEGVTSATIAFCEYMEDAGYWVGVYSSDYGFDALLDYNKVKCYAAWVANWSKTPKHDYGIHQTSDKGSISGVSGAVDLDTAVIDYEPLIKARALNGFSEALEGSQTVPAIDMPVTLKTYKKSADVELSPNFKVSEFVCKCGKYCSEVIIDLKLVAYLQAIRDHFGASVTITSGYRCPTHNANVGGASGSYHKKGRACDIIVKGVKPAEVAKYAESLGILGIGLYDSFVHIDTRSTKAFWYSSTQEPRTTFGGTPVKVETTKPTTTEKVQETTTNGLPTKRVVASQFGKKNSTDYVAEYKTTSNLNCRDGAGTGNKALCVIPEGTAVNCDGYYTDVNGTAWLDITFVLDGTQYTGFSSSAYLKKV